MLTKKNIFSVQEKYILWQYTRWPREIYFLTKRNTSDILSDWARCSSLWVSAPILRGEKFPLFFTLSLDFIHTCNSMCIYFVHLYLSFVCTNFEWGENVPSFFTLSLDRFYLLFTYRHSLKEVFWFSVKHSIIIRQSHKRTYCNCYLFQIFKYFRYVFVGIAIKQIY